MGLPRTQDGKVVLYDASTGERFARWPIDAREMLATGAYTTDTLQATNGVATVPVTTRGEPLPVVPAVPGALMSPTGAPLVIGKAVGAAQPMQFPSSASRRRR